MGRPIVTDETRRFKSYQLFNKLIIDLIDEGLKDQTVIRVCIHVYRRLAEKRMFGNQVTTDRAWDAMSLALMDELKCSTNLIEAVIKEITES